ncbi:hypothetical protein NIES970_02120 [[Synechococcus] sp. NIES-970]|nr:hypothetical protein NIES970_02120 [[Synechococcus] sp. NIES-970]
MLTQNRLIGNRMPIACQNYTHKTSNYGTNQKNWRAHQWR